MANSVAPEFDIGIAYCMAYDQRGGVPDATAIEHFRQFVASLPQAPDTQSPEAMRRHVQELQQRAETARNPQIALVMGGATKIKQYVFESAKLPEIRGASSLLDQINLVDLPALFSSQSSDSTSAQTVANIRRLVAESFDIDLPNCQDCVIYANGGEIFAFAPVSIAPQLADAIEWLYTQRTLVAGSVAAWRPFSLVELAGGLNPLAFWESWNREDGRENLTQLLGPHLVTELPHQKCFGELAAVLARDKFRRRDGNPIPITPDGEPRRPWSVAHVETMPYGERCRSCERRVAVREFPIAEVPQPVCEPCYLKLRNGWNQKRRWVQEFEAYLRQRRQKGDELFYDIEAVISGASLEEVIGKVGPPQDLNEIAQAATPPGYIGVIYADGNNMGPALEALRTPSDYATFAQAIYIANQQEVFRALSDHLQPIVVSRLDNRQGQTVDTWIHPFEILSIGGDDVFLIVPAHMALPIAHQIAQCVETRLAAIDLFQSPHTYTPEAVHRCVVEPDTVPNIQSEIALSAGVLLADAHTPIFFLQDLVEQLLKSAKTRAKTLKARHYRGGSIDFMALKSVTMITSALREFRDGTYRAGSERAGPGAYTECLSARPYTLIELNALLDTVRALKRTRFPRSQLYALRQALSRGRLASTVDYLYFSERLGKENRQHLRQVLDDRWCRGQVAPWRKRDNGDWETVLFDLLEIYDFVKVEDAP
jgi:CRISPR-associated protein Cmr2